MAKPKVIIFNSLSLDGRMDGVEQVTDLGLYYELASRWNADAMLSGSNTILAGLRDLEAQMGEIPAGPKELIPNAIPYMVIVDSHGQIGNWKVLQAQPYWRETVALCSRATTLEYLRELERNNVPYIVTGEEQVDLAQALEELNLRFGIKTVRVDSGGILNGALLRSGLVDEISILVQPVLVGGESPRSIFVAADIVSPEQVISVRLIHFEQIRDNILWLRYAITS